MMRYLSNLGGFRSAFGMAGAADDLETQVRAERLVANRLTAHAAGLEVERAGAVREFHAAIKERDEARRKWQEAEADQAEGHARIVELETKLDEARRDVKYAREDRDKAIRRANALAKEPHVAELARLQQAVDAYENRPSSLVAQDRRNAVVLCDALALSEGRKQGVGYARPADPETVERLLAAVRETVSEVLNLELERAR